MPLQALLPVSSRLHCDVSMFAQAPDTLIDPL